MREAPDLHDFIQALKNNPLVEPPPDLDPELADLIRTLAADDKRSAPSVMTLDRLWQRALTDARRASASKSKSAGGRSRKTSKFLLMGSIFKKQGNLVWPPPSQRG
jgi:hypothetical protein